MLIQIFKYFYDNHQQTAQDLVTTYVGEGEWESQEASKNAHLKGCPTHWHALAVRATLEVDGLIFKVSDI